MSAPLNLAIFVSGVGRNLQALNESCRSGELAGLARIVLVVSSASTAPAREAGSAGIDTFLYSRDIGCPRLLEELSRCEVVLIALAGYLKLIEPELVSRYRDRILNIHPALLPGHGGKGMYGLHVHRAVLDAGEKETGATVHIVDEAYDTGRILAQERVAVKADDTPEALEARVIEIEKTLYPRTIAQYIEETIHSTNNSH